MVKTLSALVMIAFFVMTASVLVVLMRAGADDSHIQQSIEDTKATTVITGRYIEHIIAERFERLYNTAYAGNDDWIMRALNGYAEYVASGSGHRGAFTVGFTNSGFKVEHSISSGAQICPEGTLISEEIASRVISGKSYAGPVSEKCAEKYSGGSSLMLFAVPIINYDDFKGVVYETSNLLDFINSYKLIDQFSRAASARILMDDILKYPVTSENFKLLKLRQSALGGVVRDEGKIIGYYTFYIGDEKLCLVYMRNDAVGGLNLRQFPWVERNKIIFFSSPFALFFVLVVLVMYQIAIRLGKDVQSRKKDIENLQHRYRRLFETIPEHIALYRKDGEIIECNSRLGALFRGGNPQGANILYLIKEKDNFLRMVHRVSEVGSSEVDEFTLIDGDALIEVTAHTCSLEIDGDLALLSVMTDLTDMKEITQGYYLAQKREVVGTVASGMVHDFSNILQNISLQYALMERAKGTEKEEQISKIKSIIDGANNYMSGVLSYTKDDKNDFEVKPASAFVRAAIDLLERVMPADIKISYFDMAGNVNIKAVQHKLTQVLINLCQNASDAMGASGEITITSEIEEKEFGNFIAIKVRDTGEGIAPEIIENIFKPFYTTKRDKGTGLGLATVKQTVMEMGGMVSVESKLGEGTEFTLLFSEKK